MCQSKRILSPAIVPALGPLHGSFVIIEAMTPDESNAGDAVRETAMLD